MHDEVGPDIINKPVPSSQTNSAWSTKLSMDMVFNIENTYGEFDLRKQKHHMVHVPIMPPYCVSFFRGNFLWVTLL